MRGAGERPSFRGLACAAAVVVMALLAVGDGVRAQPGAAPAAAQPAPSLPDQEATLRREIAARTATLGPNHPNTYDSLVRLGHNLANQGRLPEAEEQFRKALTIVEAARGPDSFDSLPAQNELASNLINQGKYQEAERRLRRALDIAKAHGDEDGDDAARSMRLLAHLLRDAQRYADIDVLTQRVVEIAERAAGPQSMRVSVALMERGRALDEIGRAAEAEDHFKRGMAIVEALSGKRGESYVGALIVMAEHHITNGRDSLAEQNLRDAARIAEESLGPDDRTTVIARGNLGLVLMRLRRFEEAARLSLDTLERIERRFGVGNPETISALSNHGSLLGNMGRFEEAESYLQRAIQAGEAMGSNDAQAADLHIDLALNLENQERHAEAERGFRKALEIYANRAVFPDRSGEANVRALLARTLLSLERTADAEEMARSAIAINAQSNRRNPSPHEVLADIFSDRNSYADAERELRRAIELSEDDTTAGMQLRLGLLYLESGRPREAASLFSQHRDLLLGLERDIGNAPAEASRSRIRMLIGRYSWIAASANWDLARAAPSPALTAEAFEALQRVRVSPSADALSEGAGRLAAERAGAGPALREWLAQQAAVKTLDDELGRATRAGSVGDAARIRLTQQRNAAGDALRRAEAALANGYPGYFDFIKYLPVPLADLQATTGENARLLREDEALILLTPGPGAFQKRMGKGFVFVVTKTATAWAQIPLGAGDLETEITALHGTLANAATVDGRQPLVAFDRARAFALYDKLFGDPQVAALLRAKPRWLLAPQGALMSLPYAALVSAPPAGGTAGDADPAALRATQWLGLTRTLAVLPSVAALRLQRLRRPVAETRDRTPFFGLGDPAFTGVADEGARGGAVGDARTYVRNGRVDLTQLALLPRLPGTEAEIRGLAESFRVGPESYVLQLAANEAELRRRSDTGALRRAEVVALSTHGLMAGDLASLSEPALALTPPIVPAGATPPADNDGLLTASEAATLQLSARFVLLSACNTAAGGAPNAEALSGLARAFLYAGAQALLVSHYPVGDEAAKALTVEAVRAAQAEGLRNPEAMRASMAKLIEDRRFDGTARSFAHPAAWAPFAVIDAN